jgi:hypothetical protein
VARRRIIKNGSFLPVRFLYSVHFLFSLAGFIALDSPDGVGVETGIRWSCEFSDFVNPIG